MTQAQLRFSSLDDYLSYSDGTDKLYELYNGKLIEVPPESGENVAIATTLPSGDSTKIWAFLNFGL